MEPWPAKLNITPYDASAAKTFLASSKANLRLERGNLPTNHTPARLLGNKPCDANLSNYVALNIVLDYAELGITRKTRFSWEKPPSETALRSFIQ
jgi:hypothetical protein